MEENVFYRPGEPSSVMSLNEEVDLFASCVNIYTTETDVYGDIMDEPHELEVFDEEAWESNADKKNQKIEVKQSFCQNLYLVHVWVS